MLTGYIRAAMRKAHYEILPDDGSFYGEIDGFQGVYANADTLEACRDELEEVLEEWARCELRADSICLSGSSRAPRPAGEQVSRAVAGPRSPTLSPGKIFGDIRIKLDDDWFPERRGRRTCRERRP